MQASIVRAVSLSVARRQLAPRALTLPRASPLPSDPQLALRPRAARPRFFSSSARTRNSSSSSSSSSRAGSSLPNTEPQGAYAKFRALTKKYGWYAAGMYTFLSAIDFSLCFFAVHTAGLERIEPYWDGAVRQYRVLRHGEAGADALEKEDERIKVEKAEQEERDRQAGVIKKDKDSKKASGLGSKALWAEIALAYAIHKTALLPFRAGVTVAVTPKFVNWLAARGWVGKGGITRAASHAQGKVRNASDKVRDRVKTLRE